MSEKTPIQLIVGLANPGPEYARTRHNAGAWLVEALAEQAGALFKRERKFHGQLAHINRQGQSIKLLIPDTYMNLSGTAVRALAQFYRINNQHMIIAHDELDIPAGTARWKFGGGAGGHNGLKDIISKQAPQKDFYRLRIGIDRPAHQGQVTSYVLGQPSLDARIAIDRAIEQAMHSLDIFAQQGLQAAQNHLHPFQA